MHACNAAGIEAVSYRETCFAAIVVQPELARRCLQQKVLSTQSIQDHATQRFRESRLDASNPKPFTWPRHQSVDLSHALRRVRFCVPYE